MKTGNFTHLSPTICFRGLKPLPVCMRSRSSQPAPRSDINDSGYSDPNGRSFETGVEQTVFSLGSGHIPRSGGVSLTAGKLGGVEKDRMNVDFLKSPQGDGSGTGSDKNGALDLGRSYAAGRSTQASGGGTRPLVKIAEMNRTKTPTVTGSYGPCISEGFDIIDTCSLASSSQQQHPQHSAGKGKKNAIFRTQVQTFLWVLCGFFVVCMVVICVYLYRNSSKGPSGLYRHQTAYGPQHGGAHEKEIFPTLTVPELSSENMVQLLAKTDFPAQPLAIVSSEQTAAGSLVQASSVILTPTTLAASAGTAVAESHREGPSQPHAAAADAERYFLVEFFAPWCGHCRRFARHVERAGDCFNLNVHSRVRMHKVDCVRSSTLCEAFNVKGYPMMLFGSQRQWEYAVARQFAAKQKEAGNGLLAVSPPPPRSSASNGDLSEGSPKEEEGLLGTVVSTGSKADFKVRSFLSSLFSFSVSSTGESAFEDEQPLEEVSLASHTAESIVAWVTAKIGALDNQNGRMPPHHSKWLSSLSLLTEDQWSQRISNRLEWQASAAKVPGLADDARQVLLRKSYHAVNTNDTNLFLSIALREAVTTASHYQMAAIEAWKAANRGNAAKQLKNSEMVPAEGGDVNEDGEPKVANPNAERDDKVVFVDAKDLNKDVTKAAIESYNALDFFVRSLCDLYVDAACRPSLCTLADELEDFVPSFQSFRKFSLEPTTSMAALLAYAPEEGDITMGMMLCGQEWTTFDHMGWQQCLGSFSFTRGYTCGLWLILHSLSANLEAGESERMQQIAAYHGVTVEDDPATMVTERRAEAVRDKVNAKTLAKVIREYIKWYFKCEECRTHFLEYSASLETTIQSMKGLSLWLWNMHNEVSHRVGRLEVESNLVDPVFPKMPYPTTQQCQHCRWLSPPSRFSSVTTSAPSSEGAPDPAWTVPWNEDEVHRWLLEFYSTPPALLRKAKVSQERDDLERPS